jgi:hypothetical protein
MKRYAIDEQIVVEIDKQRDGFSPRSIELFIPGRSQRIEPSAELRNRRFPTEPDAANAAAEELKARERSLFANWARREGFF